MSSPSPLDRVLLDLADRSPVWLTVAAQCAQWTMVALVAGATVVFDSRVFGARTLSSFYALGVGMMLATALNGLLALAIDSATHHWPYVPAPLIVVPMACAGALTLAILTRLFEGGTGGDGDANDDDASMLLHNGGDGGGRYGDELQPHSSSRAHRKRAVLVALGVALQQLPEGITTGSTYASVEPSLPDALRMQAIGVALSLSASTVLESCIEALTMSVPLHSAGIPRWQVLAGVHTTMAVQCGVAVLSCAVVSMATATLPLVLAYGGGALFYVCMSEMMPGAFECAQRRNVNVALALLGYFAMFTLLVVFGV